MILKQNGPKVFGIGLSRTGTSSLHEAFQILGYKSVHFPSIIEKYVKYGILKFDKSYRNYDALNDSPVAFRYRKLDREFPGSKFILTLRANREKWLNSVQNHKMFDPENQVPEFVQLLHKKLYGSPYFDRKIYHKAYNNHHKKVVKYFAKRPNDLLIMDITEGDGWEKLCHFLDKPVPDLPFPHANEGSLNTDV